VNAISPVVTLTASHLAVPLAVEALWSRLT